MYSSTNIQYHNKNSKTLVFMLPWVNKWCDKQNQMDIFNSMVELWISCVSMNYGHQDDNTSFDPYTQRKIEYEPIKQLRKEANKLQYTDIVFIGKSLWGVLLCETIPTLLQNSDKKTKFIILGYVPGVTTIENLQMPITIIQWEYDNFWNIEQIKQELAHKQTPVYYYEIANADHSYYDHKENNIGHQDQVIQIIHSAISKSSC